MKRISKKVVALISTIALAMSISVSVEAIPKSLQNDNNVSQTIQMLPKNIQNLLTEENALSVDAKSDLCVIPSKNLYDITVEEPEGTRTTQIFAVPIKYVDENGEIQYIDTSIKDIGFIQSIKSGYDYTNSANNFSISYSSNIAKGIKMDESFTMAIPQTSGLSEQAVKATNYNGDGKVIYNKAFGEYTIVEFSNTNSGFRNNLILEQNIGINEFSFVFNSSSHTPVLADNGTTLLVVNRHNQEEIDYVFSPIYAYDAYETTQNNPSGIKHYTEDCHYSVRQQDENSFIITISVSENFLDDPKTVYPVTVEPSLTSSASASNIEDSYVSEKSPGSNYGTYDYLRFGYDGGKIYSYVRFKSLNLPSTAYITGATLKFTFRSGQTSGSNGQCFKVNASQWYESNITWNNKPNPNNNTAGSSSSHYNYTYYEFNIKDMVKSWQQSPSLNYGIMFTYTNQTYNDYNSVVSSEGEANRAPKLTITYDLKAATTGLLENNAYYIKNVFHDKYMDVTMNYDVNLTEVLGYGFNGAVNQQWKLINCGPNKYKLKDVGSSTGKVMDVTNGKIDIYTDNDADYQKFTISRLNSLTYGRMGQYYIKYGNKYLTLSSDKTTITLTDSPDDFYGGSLWCFESAVKKHADIYSFMEFHVTVNPKDFVEKMDTLGYDPYYFYDENRSTALSNLKSDSIWFHAGHGSPGSMKFSDASITAVDINALPFNELAGLRCFITLGCSSGKSDDYGRNIIDSAFSKGAQFALGFTHTQYTPIAEAWLIRFYTRSSEGYDIKASLQYADVVANVPQFGTGMKYYKGDDEQLLVR